MNQFSTQPNCNGGYDVIRFNIFTCQWEVIETYPTEIQAKARARQLNREMNDENGRMD